MAQARQRFGGLQQQSPHQFPQPLASRPGVGQLQLQPCQSAHRHFSANSGFSPPKLCWGTGGTGRTSLVSASAAVLAGTGTTSKDSSMPTAGAGVAPGMSVGTVASLPFSAGALASGFSPPKLCWGTGGTGGTSLVSASAAVLAGTGATSKDSKGMPTVEGRA